MRGVRAGARGTAVAESLPGVRKAAARALIWRSRGALRKGESRRGGATSGLQGGLARRERRASGLARRGLDAAAAGLAPGRAGGAWAISSSRRVAEPDAEFQARGMAAAVSMAKELGASKLAGLLRATPRAALAAYAARAGLEAHIFMPKDTRAPTSSSASGRGASVTLLEGLIRTAARRSRGAKRQRAGSTFRL